MIFLTVAGKTILSNRNLVMPKVLKNTFCNSIQIIIDVYFKCLLNVNSQLRISNSQNSIESNALTRPHVLKSISLKMADDCPKVEENPVIFFFKEEWNRWVFFVMLCTEMRSFYAILFNRGCDHLALIPAELA